MRLGHRTFLFWQKYEHHIGVGALIMGFLFDLWIAKVSRCPRVPNWSRWGCNSYSP